MTFNTAQFGQIEINEAGNEAYFKRDDLCAEIDNSGAFKHPIHGTSLVVLKKELYCEVTKFECIGRVS